MDGVKVFQSYITLTCVNVGATLPTSELNRYDFESFMSECCLRRTASRSSSGVQVVASSHKSSAQFFKKASDSRRFTAVCSIYVSVTES